MNRDVQSVLLVIVGAAVGRISLDDTYLRYVKEGLQPFLVASAAVLIVLGLATAFFSSPRPAQADGSTDGSTDGTADRTADGTEADAHDPGHTPEDGHDHGHGPRVAWLLVLPVLAIFLVAPPALGSYAAERDAPAVAAPLESDFGALQAGEVIDLPLNDYAVRAVWDDGATLRGRSVRLVGFATPRPEGGWYLTRMSLSCCAADAYATKVEVRDAPAPAKDTWVTLTGRFVPTPNAGADNPIAIVSAQQVQLTEAPRNPYE